MGWRPRGILRQWGLLTCLGLAILKEKFNPLLPYVLQEPDLPMDDEIIMLRCMETFDDEDL